MHFYAIHLVHMLEKIDIMVFNSPTSLLYNIVAPASVWYNLFFTFVRSFLAHNTLRGFPYFSYLILLLLYRLSNFNSMRCILIYQYLSTTFASNFTVIRLMEYKLAKFEHGFSHNSTNPKSVMPYRASL